MTISATESAGVTNVWACELSPTITRMRGSSFLISGNLLTGDCHFGPTAFLRLYYFRNSFIFCKRMPYTRQKRRFMAYLAYIYANGIIKTAEQGRGIIFFYDRMSVSGFPMCKTPLAMLTCNLHGWIIYSIHLYVPF